MTNDPFQSDDLVPVLSLDATDDPEITFLETTDALDTGHRKMIRGFGGLAWLVVIALTLYVMFNAFTFQRQQKEVEMSPAELLHPVFMGKLALGMRELGQNQGAARLDTQLADFLEAVDEGTIEQRFCHAILVNEISGPQDALDAMAELRKKTASAKIEYDEKQNRAENVLIEIFEDTLGNNVPDLSQPDREFITKELPWFGELALNTSISDTVRRQELIKRAKLTLILVTLGAIVGLGLLLTGLIVLFIFTARILSGSLRNRVVDDSKYGPVYIETFALWFVLFVGISLAVAATGVESLGISTAAIMMLMPLSALVWPVVRGIPLNDLLKDVGLELKNPLVEVLCGFVAYLAMLPLLLVGALVSFLLLVIMTILQTGPVNDFAPKGVPHPIANEAFQGDLIYAMAVILFIVSVLAPLTEEIMFRGVLYRNLRDRSHRMARWASIIFAALFSSLIFAAIHPQGIVGIPVLTVLAFGFCLVRQWRGSLIAPMTMHAMHNTMATSLLIPMLI